MKTGWLIVVSCALVFLTWLGMELKLNLASDLPGDWIYTGAYMGVLCFAFLAIVLALVELTRLRATRNRLRRTNEELTSMLKMDSLTSVLNHRGLMELGQAECAACYAKGEPVSLIMIDLDGFKAINDSLGHLTGDEVLTRVAAVIKNTIAEKGIVARYGGDEFIVLLPRLGLQQTSEAAETLRLGFARLQVAGRGISAAFGVAVADRGTTALQHLIAEADFALLRAKAFGGGRITISLNGQIGGWQQPPDFRPAFAFIRPERQRSDYRVYESTPTKDELVILPHRLIQILSLICPDPGERKRIAEVIHSLMQTLATKDPLTTRHIASCGVYADLVAAELGLDKAERARIELAATIHDLGKLGIPNRILKKPAPLALDDWEVMKAHPTISAAILPDTEWIQPVRHLVLHHHEHYDGSGYPDGLKGEQIALGSRILLVTDAFDAMTSNRPYREALSLERVIDELRRFRGTQFDPDVLDVFFDVLFKTRGYARLHGEGYQL